MSLVGIKLSAQQPQDIAPDQEAAKEEDGAVAERTFRLQVDYFDRTVFGGDEPEAVAEARRRLDRLLRREIDALDWPCQLTDAQKQKLELAGRGDISRLFEDVREQRAKFEKLADETDGEEADFGPLYEIANSAEATMASNPFQEGSLFAKVLSKSAVGEQAARRDAVVAIRRVGGRARKQRHGKAELNEIDLRVSKFNDDGMALLGHLTNAQVLNLDSTHITDKGLLQLARLTELVSLDLGSTDITAAGLVALRDMKKLRFLDLRGARVGDKGLAHLQDLAALQHLGLFGTSITDEGLARLKELRAIEELLLGETGISDAGLASLTGFSRLNELSLIGTHVSDAGLASLAGLTNLEVIDLRNTRVSDAGLVYLRRLMKLREIYLDGTEVSDAGARELDQTLPNVRIYR
jgi:hypothetical protein